MAKGLKIVVIALTLLVGTVGVASAQVSTTGTIAGTVKDAQGGAVPGATVSLVSETRGTAQPNVITDATGSFIFVNLPADTYALQVVMSSFSTLKRSGIGVSPGDRLSLPLVIEVGGMNEAVTVKAEVPLLQTQSGERSFNVTTQSVESLPITNRSYTGLATLAPGVISTNTTQQGDTAIARVGGGTNTFTMDGAIAVDTGAVAPMLQVSVESIQEVKVLVSNYQAEYGRYSGVQVAATTKSGSNRFHGSVYDVERNSAWNPNSKTNILNGNPKVLAKERDWGYSIGGPVGSPGAKNKLFFFHALEIAPRTAGNDVTRFRFPTELERAGDFSQSLDQNGALYNLIRDASTGLPCTATNTTGCFQDNGVIGRIPANRLDQTGLNILKIYPMPNAVTPGLSYNYQITRPQESLAAYQPVGRVDYQASQNLRAMFKYTGWHQQNKVILGTVPGYNDSLQQYPTVYQMAASVNYALNPTTIVEGIFGQTKNELAGCALAQGVSGTGPTFCRAGWAANPGANRITAGLGSMPLLFPNAGVVDPSYYTFEALNKTATSIWDGQQMQVIPTFQWGTRVGSAPTVPGLPGYIVLTKSVEFTVSLTKVAGRHTIKTGYYNSHSTKNQPGAGWQGTINFGNDANNPIDSTFGFANAALGIFSSYSQNSVFREPDAVYYNLEGFIQDNWRVNSKLTLDYGLRLTHMQPVYDAHLAGSNFLLDEYSRAAAPRLYVAACTNGAVTCSGTTRQAYDPATNTFLGPNTTAFIGTVVANTGSATNGLFLQGQGPVPKTMLSWPNIGVAPRFGFAYDSLGNQRLVLRGGAGLFYERPNASGFAPINNPPSTKNLSVQFTQLQSLGTSLALQGAPNLSAFVPTASMPSSLQWNGGVQMMLPWAMVLDAEYVGLHAYNVQQSVNINSIDLGAAFLPENQDATLGVSATPGANALQANLIRSFPGYGSIGRTEYSGWSTSQSMQFSISRRSIHGLSFGFNETIPFVAKTSTAPRLQHNADGSFTVRSDQAQADKLLGSFIAQNNIMKASAIWQLPSFIGKGRGSNVLAASARDWQIAGIWTGVSGTAYNATQAYSSGSAINLTGSADFSPRVVIIGDTGSGCSKDPYRQFNTAAFAGPAVNSVGLESPNGYLRGCFLSTLDLSVARNFRFGGVNFQIRLDVFNVLNAAAITGRNASMTLTNTTPTATVSNLPFDAAGNLLANRSQPSNAGFGVANAYQNPRNVQMQFRFVF